jgi:phage gp37-like protein
VIEKDFNFYVGGIEDAMLAAITAVAGEYAGEIEPYGGELDAGKLADALEAISPRFPLFLASYTEGTDNYETARSPEPGSPWWIRHDCSFVVICADNDARGEREQRRGTAGVYRMISDVHRALSFRQFEIIVEGEPERVLLNAGELIPAGIEHIAHLPEQTAYAVPFTAYFRYLSPDRRDASQEINSIIFTLDPTNSRRGKGSLPGVKVNLQ